MRLFNFKGEVVRQIVRRSKELRVECNRAGHTYIELRTAPGCPHAERARAILADCLTKLGIDSSIVEMCDFSYLVSNPIWDVH
jgi:hypothetical protein